MSQVVVIGTGPAGIAAAIYAVRAGMETVVIGKDNGSLEKVGLIENYWGFPEPVEGAKLVRDGIAQAKRLGAKIVQDEVVGIGYLDSLTVKTKFAEYTADAVILATGSSRKKPGIAGIEKYEGKGVSYCATCDAFFYRKKNVAILGSGEFALSEAMELAAVASSVTILTNGAEFSADAPEGIQLITKKVEALEGEDKLSGVRFSDGTSLPFAGIFIALGVASSGDLAKKIGAILEGTTIVINEKMETNVPGLYAAGDCTGGWLQVSKAVYEGAKAGHEAAKYLRSKIK